MSVAATAWSTAAGPALMLIFAGLAYASKWRWALSVLFIAFFWLFVTFVFRWRVGRFLVDGDDDISRNGRVWIRRAFGSDFAIVKGREANQRRGASLQIEFLWNSARW